MLLSAAAVWIGSQACRPCHAAIADAYARTPMAQSSGRVDSLALPAARFTAAGHQYRVADNRLFFRLDRKEDSVSMDFFVGSGAAGRSFLFGREGFLFELPVTWYTRKGIWDASPGYQNDEGIQLNRAVEPTCLSCHASRVRPVSGTQNRYGDPPFLEGGVGCERCHGLGSEHVRSPKTARLVNPAKLVPAERDSVCSQCHLTGDARIELPGRRIAEFQAGEDLATFATYFVRNLPGLKVTSHVEKLAGSRCKQGSGDKLWCGTCHDPHTEADTRTVALATQKACVACHATAHRQGKTMDQTCATCHMPKSGVVDGGHGVLTDHSIRARPQLSQPEKGGELTVFLGTANDRSLGLAYAELGDPRARAYLLRAKPADAEVRLRLAALEPDQERAASLYESVLREHPWQQVALVNLGSLYAGAGHLEAAVRLWERALTANPALEQAVFNLAQIERPESARARLLRYLEFNPASAEAQVRLRAIPAR